MTEHFPVQRRRRGVILSPQGWQRLQAAEQQAADHNNAGKPYTLDQLGERTGLSPNTITKVRRRRLAVDRQTLESYFNALDLTLVATDYISVDADHPTQRQPQKPLQGQVPLDSNFYIERPPYEFLATEEVLQPGALVRIKSPRQFGKTSLMARVLAAAHSRGCKGVVLNLQLADAAMFTDLTRFLRWFCAVVTRDLQLPEHLDEHWHDVFGSSYNCTDYFEQYLLSTLDSPLVLALDETDRIFNYPAIASDFFGMLRAWYEKSKYGNGNSSIWQRLRLMVLYSSESYLPLNLSGSPFNVGLLLELPPFTLEQVQDLAQRYGLESSEYALELMNLLGGIPYLTQLALHHLSSRNLTLPEFLQAVQNEGIFDAYLRKQLSYLLPSPDLLSDFKQVVLSPTPVELNPIRAFQLQSLGLIQLSNLQAQPACRLYRTYFSQVLPILSQEPEQ
ncbi:MAG: AAA-like domain-containing protein [Synechococcales cyanobacterium M58_A2018_015]|nr:AAA-like domain-containing protein [Synechococcales cyanobacterium M58_A2018_015]